MLKKKLKTIKVPLDPATLARRHSEKALETLAMIMQQPDAPPASRLAAANAILERGWGKAGQPRATGVDATDTRPLSELTMAELLLRTARTLEGAEKSMGAHRER